MLEITYSWRRVKLGNFVTFHHLPISTFVWIDRSRFKHKSSATIQERPVNNVSVTSNPSAISNARKYISRC